MFTTRIKSAIGIALAIGVTCVIGISSQPPVQGAPARPFYQCQKDSKLGPVDNVFDNMFPDGVMHDFGKVQRGTLPKYSFRIVNTSDVPIRIVDVRQSMSPVSAYPTESFIQPSQEVEIVTSVDTNRFVGERTYTLFVTIEVAGRPQTMRLWLKANSVNSD